MIREVRKLREAHELRTAWPVMSQLRSHLDEEGFITQARRQFETGYLLAGLFGEERVLALAGYRYMENLYAGRNMYVDDLVTDERVRGTGAGKILFEWLINEAKSHGCAQLHLDSGVQRHAAHRFYLSRGMIISGHHFQVTL